MNSTEAPNPSQRRTSPRERAASFCWMFPDPLSVLRFRSVLGAGDHSLWMGRSWGAERAAPFPRGSVMAAGWLVLSCGLAAPQATAQDAAPSPPPAVERSLAQEPGPTSAASGQNPTATRPRLLSDPFQTPRQLLQLMDIGPSEWNAFVDGQAISPVDEEALVKILFRMPHIELRDIERWLHKQVAWDQLLAESAAQRGEFYLLSGRAHSITRLALRPRLAGLFEFDHYYQVRVALEQADAGGSGGSVLVCTRTVPAAWQDRTALDERCRVTGMFIKREANRDDQPQLLFAAPNIAWLPDRVDPSLGIGKSEVLLGQLGMDVGLFDAVRPRNGLPIGASERECFYALLQAAARAEPQQLTQLAVPLQLAPLLQHPESAHGHLLTATGTVQRITRVVVNEADIAHRFGIDHYYQLDVLVPVGDAAVEVRNAGGGSQGPVYRNAFPFTCCCLTLPEQWQPLLGRSGISEDARLTGFFFKLWAYPNPYVASFDERQRQLSPMLMLHEPIPRAPGKRVPHSTGLLVGAGFLVVLATLWGFVLWMNRSDRQHRVVLLQQRFGEGETPDFEPLDRPDK